MTRMVGLSRRDTLKLGASGFAAALVPCGTQAQQAAADPNCSASSPLLASPNFGSILRFVSGMRPNRIGSYKLDGTPDGDKFVIHNYGHAGAGITMSWGCALQVRKIFLEYEGRSRHKDIAILGAGVMGLTTATLLNDLKLGLRIKVYAQHFTPHTTSDVAGGQWLPSSVSYENTTQFRQILRDSFHMHEARGSGFGVFRRKNFVLERPSTFDDQVPRDLVPAPKCYSALPFSKLRSKGYSYETLLVEPPIFLSRLHADLFRSPNVKRVQKTFTSHQEVMELPEKIIINCTGLGAATLWNDPQLFPVKGQLVLLRPQPKLNYMLSGLTCHTGDERRSWFQYLFPRHDCVVVGGTYEPRASGGPNDAVCRTILSRMKRLFDGDLSICASSPFTS